MAALTQDRDTQFREGVDFEYPVAANAKIYAGSMVNLNTSGYAKPGADVASEKFVGIAQEQVDNTGGANGAKTVVVRRKGVFELSGSSLAITDVGAAVYVSDDQTVAKTTTNSVACGKIAGFRSATSVWVDIDMR